MDVHSLTTKRKGSAGEPAAASVERRAADDSRVASSSSGSGAGAAGGGLVSRAGVGSMVVNVPGGGGGRSASAHFGEEAVPAAAGGGGPSTAADGGSVDALSPRSAEIASSAAAGGGSCSSTDPDVIFALQVRDAALRCRELSLRLVVAVTAAGEPSPATADVTTGVDELSAAAAALTKVLTDKLAEQGSASRAKAERLQELFGEASRRFKQTVGQLAKEAQAAAKSPGAKANDRVRGAHSILDSQAMQLAQAAVQFSDWIKARNEKIKTAVLAQCKQLIVSLRRLREVASSSVSDADFEQDCANVSQQLQVFFRIAEAAVPDTDAQLLRSACSNVTECAKQVRAECKRGGGGAPALSSSPSATGAAESTSSNDDAQEQRAAADKKLQEELTLAVNSIRQVMYRVLSMQGADSGGALHSQSDRLRARYAVQLDREQQDAVLREHMVVENPGYRIDEPSGNLTECAAILEKNQQSVGFYDKHFFQGLGQQRHARPQLNLTLVHESIEGGVAVVSVCREPLPAGGADGDKPQHVAVVRTRNGDELAHVPAASGKDKDLIKAVKATFKWAAKADVRIMGADGPDEEAELIKELAQFESKNMMRSFKFGFLVLSKDCPPSEEDPLYRRSQPHAESEQVK